MKLPRLRLLALPGALLVAGCATMISGTTQRIKLHSNESDVRVTIQPGNVVVMAPGETTLKRSESGYRLRFEKDGFEPVDVRLESGTNGWVWGNLIIGGLIGLAIDYGNGAAYTLTPDTVTANLKRLAVQPSVGTESHLFIFDTDGALLVVATLQ
jgi:hypothetical protein